MESKNEKVISKFRGIFETFTGYYRKIRNYIRPGLLKMSS